MLSAVFNSMTIKTISNVHCFYQSTYRYLQMKVPGNGLTPPSLYWYATVRSTQHLWWLYLNMIICHKALQVTNRTQKHRPASNCQTPFHFQVDILQIANRYSQQYNHKWITGNINSLLDNSTIQSSANARPKKYFSESGTHLIYSFKMGAYLPVQDMKTVKETQQNILKELIKQQILCKCNFCDAKWHIWKPIQERTWSASTHQMTTKCTFYTQRNFKGLKIITKSSKLCSDYFLRYRLEYEELESRDDEVVVGRTRRSYDVPDWDKEEWLDFEV